MTAPGAGDRQAIVDALAKVDGLNPTASIPPVIVAGSAWPVWTATTWINQCVRSRSYFVFVALPNVSTEGTADDGDALEEDVAAVLFPLGKVARNEPRSWAVDPGQQAVPVLQFTLEVSQ